MTATGSLWAATAEPAPPTQPLDGSRQAAVAVIGAGYTGLSAALHLAEGGVSVTVLEAFAIGHGASGRNGGQVNPGLRLDPDALVARFGKDVGEAVAAASGNAPDLVFALVERHAIPCEARRPGWLQLAHSEPAMRKLEARAEQWSRRGVAMQLLDRGAAAAIAGTGRYLGGLLDPRGGSVQPLSYVRGLARAAMRAGASVHENSPASGLHQSNGKWQVTTPRGTVTADSVIIATNGYTGGLWPGLRLSLLPVNTFQVATKPLGENLRRTILPGGHAASDSRRLILYFRTDEGHRLIMGGRASFTQRETPRFHRFLHGVVCDMFPQLGDPGFEHGWAGKVAITLDLLPHLHQPRPDLWIAVGYNGRGVAMATLMGKSLAQRTLGDAAIALPWPTTEIRPIPFHLARRPVLHLAMQANRFMDWLGR